MNRICNNRRGELRRARLGHYFPYIQINLLGVSVPLFVPKFAKIKLSYFFIFFIAGFLITFRSLSQPTKLLIVTQNFFT